MGGWVECERGERGINEEERDQVSERGRGWEGEDRTGEKTEDYADQLNRCSLTLSS